MKNNDKAGEKEIEKLLDIIDPYNLTPGFKPVPITCPKCGNYRDNMQNGMYIQVKGMPQRKLYTCSKCGELFNDPPQSE